MTTLDWWITKLFKINIMNNFLKSFLIKNLFGYKNISIEFKDDSYILVGENGSGKTTILNCLYYVLANKMTQLSKIKFDSINMTCENNKKFIINKYEVEARIAKDEGFSNASFYRTVQRELKPEQFKKIRDIVISGKDQEQKQKEIFSILNDKLGFNFRAPSSYIYRSINNLVQEQLAAELDHKLEELKRLMDFQIIFMPTYRRIESSLVNWKHIVNNITRNYPIFDIDDFDFKDFTSNEVIQFGMEDVQSKIDSIKQSINQITKDSFPTIMANLLTFLSSGVRNQDIDSNFDNSVVNIILDRLGDQIKDDIKETIRNYVISNDMSNDNLNYLISSLIVLYKNQERFDVAIKNFRDICNRYLFAKEFVYNESTVDLYIESKHNKERLDLECLSSGEKQIVSLFSRICLDVDTKFMVLFDEPELSLSIFWQETLLKDVMDTGKCNFLFAVTHSPFIYQKYMDNYTHSMFDIDENEL